MGVACIQDHILSLGMYLHTWFRMWEHRRYLDTFPGMCLSRYLRGYRCTSMYSTVVFCGKTRIG